MDKLGLYNKALSVIDMRVDDLTTPCKELALCDAYFDECVDFVMYADDFGFMMKSVKLTEKVEGAYPPKKGFRTCWRLPSDFGKVHQIDGSMEEAYLLRRDGLWTMADEPVLEYTPKGLETDAEGEYTANTLYLSLVAYQLALKIAPRLAPESSAQGVAAQLYNLNLRTLKDAELRNTDNPQMFGSSPDPYVADTSRFA